MTPYLAYWVPEHLGGSGVLATVAAGLYVSWNGPLLISAATRLQGIFFWDLIIYLIEGLVFLLTGLQARTLLEKAHCVLDPRPADRDRDHHGDRDRRALRLGVPGDLSAALAEPVAARARSFAALARIRSCWRSPACAASCRSPRRSPFRSRPPAGEPFPYRDLILFVTFGVIIITLVGQGLMLPSVVRWLGLTHEGRAEQRREREAELAARAQALGAALDRLEAIAAERQLSGEALDLLRARHEQRMRQLPRNMDDGLELTRLSNDLRIDLIDAERRFLYQLLRDGKLTDESRRRIERELDLEEESIACRKEGEAPL